MNYWYSFARWGAAVLASGLLLAQPAAAQTRRATLDLQLWPELQAELALKNGDYLFLGLRGQRDVESASYNGDARRLGFDERRVTLGYEHFWSEHWSGGGTLRLEALGYKRLVLVPEALLRHRSSLAGLTFGQRLSLERTLPNNAGYVGGPGPDGQNWARLRVDLEKLVPVGSGGFALRPRLSYEAATRIRLLKSNTDAKQRSIDFTSARAELGCRVSDHFDITPWVASQTRYSFTLAQTDVNGNVTIPAGRLNLATPVIGIDARFTLFQGKTVFERQQLPTQH
ncbi:hypothetical protein AUC43_08265 [Hymenobacter sedentarius]|uniref:Alginate export domain-containing protein n=1 Tax=Hymenobacter sedentarius TaxID=1411621 RepID=A0A0U4BET6_9BACT|nr:hypothetical protein [Hymenobacter sedentarius]ALW85083.1 hypothetical protein AUC43_08265 [Hymenobacter sedentarius]